MRRGSLVVVALVAVVALAGCDWTQVGFGPGKTNFNPDEQALTSSSVAHLTTAWSQSCVCLTPLVVGGVVYTANFLGGLDPRPVKLEAIDEGSGNSKWAVTLPSVNFALFVGVGNGLAYVDVLPASGSEKIVAYDANTGAFQWEIVPPATGTGTTNMTEAKVLDGGLLFVAASAGGADEVSAIDTTGHVAWSMTPGGRVGALTANPGKTLYVASFVPVPLGGVPRLTGYAESNGASQSSVIPLTNETNAPSNIAFANGLVYDRAFAIHPDTGMVAWSAPGELVSAVTGSAAVMLNSAATSITALNPNDGTFQWSAPARPLFPQNPVVAGNLVFVAHSGAPDMQVRDLANGNVLGTSPSLTGTDYYISPSGGRVIVQAGGTLYALAPS